MFKHRLMLSAAVTVLSSTPAFAACTSTTDVPQITTVGTSPIDTCTDGAITIATGGGVKLNSQTGTVKPDVTVNNPNSAHNTFVNDGTLTNTNASGAAAILIDASATGGPAGSVTNAGTIDLSGSGIGKAGIELTGGTFTGNIATETSVSNIKIVGDNSTAVEIASGSTLVGELNLDGGISMAPTSGDSATTNSTNVLVNILGAVKGNVTIGSTASFIATGNNADGIVVGGSIQANGSDAGSLVNEGTIALTRNQTNSGTRAEGGTALLVENGVAGGILNAANAVITSSGSDTSAGITPVVLIENGLGSANETIGALPTATDASVASFANRSAIIALPNNTDVSSVAVQITGNSTGAQTILSGGFFNAGEILASASSKNGAVGATAIDIANYATLTGGLTISGEDTASGTVSTLGLVSASANGIGGAAQAILINANASVPVINVTRYARVLASVTTQTPTTTTVERAGDIEDLSGTLTTINNAGTIEANGTVLTRPDGAQGTFTAIDLSQGSNNANNIVINNAGTVLGNILVGSGTGNVVNVGAGSASGPGSFAAQNTAAANAATATGLTDTPSILASVDGDLTFGTASPGSPDKLYINDFGTYIGQLYSNSGNLDVGVSQYGTLVLTNKTNVVTNLANPLVVHNFDTAGGSAIAHSQLDLTTSEEFRLAGDATVSAISTGEITLGANTSLGVTLASYVPQQTGSCLSGCQYILLKAPTTKLTLTPADLVTAQNNFFVRYPYFFDSASALSQMTVSGSDELILTLKAKPPTGPGGLGLTGEALTMFGPASTALLTRNATSHLSDDILGEAVLQSSRDQQSTEQVFSQFAPDVSGDVRAVAVALTDQATGPVAARQRQLRMYANQEGDFTLWGQEFAQYLNDKGKAPGGELVQYKDHGFGFVLGLDMGNPTDGWYGGAVTFYAGDATEQLPRDAKNQTEWGMLTGYTDWRGRHLFLDTQLTAGYGSFRGKRILDLTVQNTSGGTSAVTREADGKRAGLLAAGGLTTGAAFDWGSTVFMPQVSVDGLVLREEGFTETGGGDGFNLTVQPYYASSLRTFLGADLRQDMDLGIFTLQPEARLGYRFDFLNDPVKIKGAFAVDPTHTTFTLTGPDPTRGNVVAGATVGASTDTWSMGLNFDWVRGSNGSTTEVGTLSLLGRI